MLGCFLFHKKIRPQKGLLILNGARNRTKSELYDFVIELKKVLSQDFISKLKSLDIAA